MQAFIDVSLNIFYVLMGLLMIYMAYKALTTIQGSKRFGTALFLDFNCYTIYFWCTYPSLACRTLYCFKQFAYIN